MLSKESGACYIVLPPQIIENVYQLSPSSRQYYKLCFAVAETKVRGD